MINFLFILLMGIVAGSFTGMIPGLHINLISALLVSNISLFGDIASVQHISVFIISMSVTHTFVDSIPGIYLGAPDISQFLTALPGHKMFLEGKAHYAVKLTLVGSLFGLFFSLSLLALFSIVIFIIYDYLQNFIGIILILISIFIILDLNSFLKTFNRLLFFLISGTYGAIIFNIDKLSNPMFHMLSGFFGLSILLESLKSKTKPVKQELTSEINYNNTIFTTFISSISGFFAAFMPGFSTSQNAVVLSKIFKNLKEDDFLILLGGLNTAGMVASLASFYSLNRARNGSIIAIQTILGSLDINFFIILVLVILISGLIALIIAIKLSKFMAKILSFVDYRKLIFTVIFSIITISIIFDGVMGFAILFFCTFTGLSASHKGVSKNYLMGCIMLPVIFYFIF